MPVDLYGYVADMPDIVDLCRQKGLICVEDAAQAARVPKLTAASAGSFADMAIFFLPIRTRTPTTMGEGGMFYVADEKLRKACSHAAPQWPIAPLISSARITGSRPWATWICQCWTARRLCLQIIALESGVRPGRENARPH